ncbi:MAG TPA: NAD-dependent epimerase/dehydratase family protein, partial [Gammaproteobacteria bacterium]|nr:NAD-dependent epimerase/dehydratase family protein [Gammaproteobacteria bacterium]
VDVSTSEVYGGGENGFCREDMDRIVPARTTVRLEYAVAKLAAETAIINTCKVTELDARIVRPFNVAGPRQSGAGGFVVPRFISQALAGQPLTVFGNGRQVRAFTHVGDIAKGIMAAMSRGKRGEAYNLGNPKNRVTIRELAEIVNRIVGNEAGVTFVDPKEIFGPLYAEAADKTPDAERAKKELGWRPLATVGLTVLDAYLYARPHPFAEMIETAKALAEEYDLVSKYDCFSEWGLG